MELFYITCTTCRRRLKVCDESAIGQILACPGCQGMVQVVPPADWKPSPPAGTRGASAAPSSSPPASRTPAPSSTPSPGISPSPWAAGVPRATPVEATFDDAAALLGEPQGDVRPSRPVEKPAPSAPAVGAPRGGAPAGSVPAGSVLPSSTPPSSATPGSGAAAGAVTPGALPAKRTPGESGKQQSPAPRPAPRQAAPPPVARVDESLLEPTVEDLTLDPGHAAAGRGASPPERIEGKSARWRNSDPLESPVAGRPSAASAPVGNAAGSTAAPPAPSVPPSVAAGATAAPDVSSPAAGPNHHAATLVGKDESAPRRKAGLSRPLRSLLAIGAGLLGIVLAVAIFLWAATRTGRSPENSKLAGENQRPAGRDRSQPPAARQNGNAAAASGVVKNDAPPVPDRAPSADAPPPSTAANAASPANGSGAGDPAADAPPEFADTGDDAGSSAGEEGADAPAADAPPDDTLAGADPLARFAPFLDSGSVEVNPAGEEGAAGAGGAEAEGVGDPPADAPEKPTPRHVNVEARLADRLEAIEVTEAPLDELLRLLSDLSTIPITVEPWALLQSQTDPAAPVTLKLHQPTVADVLGEALSPFRLGYVTHDQGISITRPDPADGPREVSYNVKDLTGGSPEELNRLASVVKMLVAPASWSDAGGAGEMKTTADALVVRQTAPVHFEVLTFCEKLRVARGLAVRSALDARLFSLDTRRAQASAALATNVTANYVRPARLVDVLDHLEKAAGVTILVDWRATMTEGWSPDTETAFTSAGPLSQTLDKLLSPMGLAVRIIDGKTFEVTTLAELNAKPELEMYSLPSAGLASAPPAEVLEKIAKELGIAAEGEGAFAGLHIDAASQCLLASLPQPRQAAVERLLATWPK